MSDNWGRGGIGRAAERIRRIFGSEAEWKRLEQAEVEQLRASGWRPKRPASVPIPEGGYGVADAGKAVQRQIDYESAYLAEARRRLAERQRLTQAPAADLRSIPPRKPPKPRVKSRSRNNELVAGWGDSFDRSQWRPVGRVDARQRTRTFDAGKPNSDRSLEFGLPSDKSVSIHLARATAGGRRKTPRVVGNGRVVRTGGVFVRPYRRRKPQCVRR